MSDVTPQVASLMRQLGIRDYDPDSELHRSLAETFQRVGNMQPDVLYPAVMWCYHAEFDRQVDRMSRSKVEYDRTLGAGVIRYRAQGERSAEVAKMKAESHDEGVYMARLELLSAEGMMKSAQSALDILHAQLRAWQTRQADARKADELTTRTQP